MRMYIKCMVCSVKKKTKNEEEKKKKERKKEWVRVQSK
jgi:hypothetical protein